MNKEKITLSSFFSTMYFILFIIFILQHTAIAENFRGVTYGVGCDYIDLQEHNAGSLPTKKNYQYLIEDFTYLGVKFRGTSRLVYLCNEDNLFIGAEIYLPNTHNSIRSLNYHLSELHGQGIYRNDEALFRIRYTKYMKNVYIWPLPAPCNYHDKFILRDCWSTNRKDELCNYIALGKTFKNTDVLQFRGHLEVNNQD